MSQGQQPHPLELLATSGVTGTKTKSPKAEPRNARPSSASKPAGQNSRRANSRERIIDAALDLCCIQGVRHLSLDAVAERAGLSKGGLLYNFNSKSALLQAMVTRHMDLLETAKARALASIANDGKPNVRIRAYLLAIKGLISSEHNAPAGFLAAIAEEPELLDPAREHHERFVREIRAESENPDLAIYAFAAVEGLRSLRLFGMSPFCEKEMARQLDGLINLLGAPEGAASSGTGQAG